jgi:signal peptidase I
MYSNYLTLKERQGGRIIFTQMQNDYSELPTVVETAPEEGAEPKKGTSAWRFILDVLETIVLSVVLFLAINAVSARIRVDGFSMEPTLHNGEFVIVNKLTYRFSHPGIGDVIVFRYPRNPQEEYIKRVIGLPGDRVVVTNGQVSVNGYALNEPYIASAPRYNSDWTVPENSLFVLGDNRNNSSDSHNWGPVPMENVIGKALFVYWPPNEWGFIEHPTTVSAAK